MTTDIVGFIVFVFYTNDDLLEILLLVYIKLIYGSLVSNHQLIIVNKYIFWLAG